MPQKKKGEAKLPPAEKGGQKPGQIVEEQRKENPAQAKPGAAGKVQERKVKEKK